MSETPPDDATPDDATHNKDTIYFLALFSVLTVAGRYPVMATMVQSEALFNAGVTSAIINYYRSNEGSGYDRMLMFPLHNQGTAAFVAFSLGKVTVRVLEALSAISGDSAIAAIVCGTYFTYFLLEKLDCSGVTGVVVYTMAVNSHRFVACTDLIHSLEEYWNILYDVTGTLASSVAASYTAYLLIQYAATLDWAVLFVCYLLRISIRCVAVALLYPVIGHFGYQVTVRQATVLAWAGIKGTFLASIATVQYLRRENTNTENVTKSYLYVIGDMVLTQLVNVTFLPMVLQSLGTCTCVTAYCAQGALTASSAALARRRAGRVGRGAAHHARRRAVPVGGGRVRTRALQEGRLLPPGRLEVGHAAHAHQEPARSHLPLQLVHAHRLRRAIQENSQASQLNGR